MREGGAAQRIDAAGRDSAARAGLVDDRHAGEVGRSHHRADPPK